MLEYTPSVIEHTYDGKTVDQLKNEPKPSTTRTAGIIFRDILLRLVFTIIPVGGTEHIRKPFWAGLLLLVFSCIAPLTSHPTIGTVMLIPGILLVAGVIVFHIVDSITSWVRIHRKDIELWKYAQTQNDER